MQLVVYQEVPFPQTADARHGRLRMHRIILSTDYDKPMVTIQLSLQRVVKLGFFDCQKWSLYCQSKPESYSCTLTPTCTHTGRAQIHKHMHGCAHTHACTHTHTHNTHRAQYACMPCTSSVHYNRKDVYNPAQKRLVNQASKNESNDQGLVISSLDHNHRWKYTHTHTHTHWHTHIPLCTRYGGTA